MSTLHRQRVVRADGRAINVVQRRAHLSYCFTGCCCGRVERGRGASAQVLVEPTSSRCDVERSLQYLPTGGRTPLAHALELAAGYVTDDAVAVLVTDGHANVPTRTDDAWADAMAAASALGCLALVIDTEDAQQATGRPRQLAEAMRGACIRLSDLDQPGVLRLIREVS